MAELKVTRGGETKTVSFEGPQKLDELLVRAGMPLSHPCGGRGTCGKCAVEIEGEISAPTEAERQVGARLSCQVTVFGNAEVRLPDEAEDVRIETDGRSDRVELHPMPGTCGAAVDIGTTTLAVKLFNLTDGACLSTQSCRNPQVSVAADVMGRIGAAMNGGLSNLQEQIRTAIGLLLEKGGVPKPDSMVVTGNTTMLYLLTGRDPTCLSHAPFEADTLFGNETELLGAIAYLPPCMNAFVGADITCAVLASGVCDRAETALLCDIGTNGELALWHNGVLYVTSTAAGPAFEGAGISCGCGSIAGAVDRVTVENGELRAHTIDGVKAVGVCGSGLIDAVAAGLELGLIDETGLLEEEELLLAEGVALQQKDIRAVQLAKAAIAAGIATLLDSAGVLPEQVKQLCIAGGFGSHLNVDSAAAIGLLPPELAGRAVILGNAALSGAVHTLLDSRCRKKLEKIAACSAHVNLGGNPKFNERYLEEMLFGE